VAGAPIGAFGRANDAQFAGDGVTVAILRNGNTTNPLFTASIPSSAAVGAANLFKGPGAAPFKLALSLVKGDIIRFVVFSGANDDNGFDATALSLSLIRDPVPPFHLNASGAANNFVIRWSSLTNESYDVVSSTNLRTRSAETQLLSSFTNQLVWPSPINPSPRFFRVRLLP
jgi:hypothetical protein